MTVTDKANVEIEKQVLEQLYWGVHNAAGQAFMHALEMQELEKVITDTLGYEPNPWDEETNNGN